MEVAQDAREPQPDATPGEPVVSRWIIVLSALIYPFWHLASPESATDPWIFWWLVAASFLAVELASRWFDVVARNVMRCFYLCAWLCTLQLFTLAYVNDMKPFYVVGSVMSVLATSVFIRALADHIAFGTFVLVISVVLFALDPDPRKAAYWGGMLTIIAASYYRLSSQIEAATLARRHQERLEEAVEARTAELSDANRRLRAEMEKRQRLEEELRIAQKLEALGRLAGGVAHEFNNLLTRIRLYAEFAADRADEGTRDDVDEIQKAVHQAATLTRQLLTFSRRGEVDAEVLDLSSVVEESSAMIRHLLGESIEFRCDLGEGEHTIRADRGQIEQVLVNLVLNARDAMGERGRFAIETSVVRRGGTGSEDLPEALADRDTVRLSVSDSGIGMDAETRARAFDPFFTRKPVDEGTGLGLSIVYGIVNRAGGHVRVSSEPGKGARFELYWPFVRRPVEAAHEPDAAEATIGRGNENVLLVEDESELRTATRRLLMRCGYRVWDTGDPESALQIASQIDEPVHLLLTDVVMPKMNGVDLADAICATRPETRVLLTSGYMDLHQSLERDLPPGVGYIAKPYESEALSAKVRQVLDAPRADVTLGGRGGPLAN